MRSTRKVRKSSLSSHQARQDPHRTEEGERQRSHRPLARPAQDVGVTKAHLLSAANGLTQLGEIARDRFDAVSRRRKQGGIRHVRAQRLWNDSLDLGNGIGCSNGEFRIGPGLDHAGAKHQRLDLLLLKHQRRQIEPRLQNVSDTGLALDRNAGRHEVADVAVDRSFRYLQRIRELARANGRAAAHVLNDLEQPVGSAHGAFSRRNLWAQSQQTLLTPSCQEPSRPTVAS
jgi:hypothetical protein